MARWKAREHAVTKIHKVSSMTMMGCIAQAQKTGPIIDPFSHFRPYPRPGTRTPQPSGRASGSECLISTPDSEELVRGGWVVDIPRGSKRTKGI